jgi:hypothetical protein
MDTNYEVVVCQEGQHLHPFMISSLKVLGPITPGPHSRLRLPSSQTLDIVYYLSELYFGLWCFLLHSHLPSMQIAPIWSATISEL